jgi:hypothetical protein
LVIYSSSPMVHLLPWSSSPVVQGRRGLDAAPWPPPSSRCADDRLPRSIAAAGARSSGLEPARVAELTSPRLELASPELARSGVPRGQPDARDACAVARHGVRRALRGEACAALRTGGLDPRQMLRR